MSDSLKKYWEIRFKEVKAVLEENNFEVYIADNNADAKKIVLDEILPGVKPKSISWGGSVTFTDSGLYDVLKNNEEYEILDTFEKKLSLVVSPKKLPIQYDNVEC